MPVQPPSTPSPAPPEQAFARPRFAALARVPRLMRFLLSGGFNTLASYAVYVLLLGWLGHRWAYVGSYAFGMVLGYGLLRWLVFQAAGRPHAWAWVALTQLGQLLLGLAVVELWVRVLHGPPVLAALAAVAVTVPASYAVHRWVFRTPAHDGRPHGA